MNRKILYVILTICMVVTMQKDVFAVGNQNSVIDSQTVYAKTAYVKDINEYGSNLNTDIIDGTQYKLPDTELSISTYSDYSLNISANINGDEVILTGTPAGRSENGQVLFFEGDSSNSKYSVILFDYEQSIAESVMYFESNMNQSKLGTMLKIYLKVNDSNTRDYIFIESFDFVPVFEHQFILDLPQEPLMGAWAVKEFKPIVSEFGEDLEATPSTRSAANNKNWYITQEYYEMRQTVTDTIKFLTQVDYSDLPVGQEVKEYFRLQITGKSIVYSRNTELNSDTMGALHITGLSLEQVSIPNAAWKSTTISGVVFKPIIGSASLTASLGWSYGLLGVSYSFPISFGGSQSMKINEWYNPFLNGTGECGDCYTRAIETKTNNWLTQIGHYFQVDSIMRDYTNVKASAQTMKSRWNIEITNMSPENGNAKSYYYCDHDVLVSIV